MSKEIKVGLTASPYFADPTHGHLAVSYQMYEAILKEEPIVLHIHVFKEFPFITPTGLMIKEIKINKKKESLSEEV